MLKLITLLSIAATTSLAFGLPDKYVVVPNRSDSTITLLSTPKGDVIQRVDATQVGQSFEPIYASSVPRYQTVAVSDRKNSQLLFFDNRDFRYLGSVPTSQGMFHMWPAPDQKEIYAVADIDRVVDVVAINRFDDQIAYHKRRIDVGALFATGKPHDIVADKDYIFITMIGVEEDSSKYDYILKYNRRTLALLDQMRLSFDTHLGIPAESPYLLIPEQTAGRLNFVDKKTFKVVTTVEGVPGSHGIYWNSDASRIYLANFTSQGPMSVYEVRQKEGTLNFQAKLIKTHALQDAKAHNVTVDFANQVMFVTHSGPNKDGNLNTNVSLFSVAGDSKFLKTVESGLNPLGILLVTTR